MEVAELKAGISLVGLFERDGHTLRKTGADTWTCRCPFHDEKSGSCVVHDQKAFFKCFGCDAKGTIFEYWGLSRGIEKGTKEGFAEICRQLTELMTGSHVPAPRARKAEAPKEADRPAPLSGRDLEKWNEGCAFLALHEDEQERLAQWRGYQRATVAALAAQGKMGLPIYFGKRLPGFAVETVNEHGEPYLAGFHVRLDPEPGQRPMWHFVPKGIGSWPFVLGDPRTARAVVILEGQWDAVAFVDALDQGVPPRNRVAVLGVRGSGAWEKTLVWAWPEDTAQVWLYADGDEAGLRWLNEEGGFAAQLRRRAKALHAHAMEGVKDFNEAHQAAVAQDRGAWTEDLRETMRRQWTVGQRRRRYRKRERVSASD